MNPLFTNAPIVWREHYDFDYEKIMPVIEETFSLCGERQVRKVFLENGEAGHVLDENLTIACGSSSVKILELQRQGKNKQTSKEFLLGNKIDKGTIVT